MPPGANSLGNNRFALLSPGPKNKRKKPENSTLEFFPELPISKKDDPKYLIIKSQDAKKPIASTSCFAVHKGIQAISKEINKITPLRDGSLLLLVKNQKIADKFLQTKHLPGAGAVEVSLHNSLNSVKERLLGTMTSLKPFNAAIPKYGAGTQPFTVLIEGNIGSGKTTFIEHFQKFEDKVCAMAEPVEKWRNFKGYNLLELMYIDPDRWAMPFQSYVMLTMLERHTKPTDKPIKILERSLYSAKYCFVENLHKSGLIHDGMYEILKEWYSYVEDITHIQADLIVYLRTTPEVVYERIRKRARSEESCVPLEYIKQLHELHEDWLIRKKMGSNIKVLEIEADLDLSEIDREYKRSENVITASIQQQRPVVTASPSKRSDFLG